MATLLKQFTFVAATTINPSQVNANFDDLYTFVNNSLVHVDGSRAMTGALDLVAADPTSGNQATRKSYVDAQVATANTAAANALTTAGYKARALASNGSIQMTPPALPNWATTPLLIQGGRLDVTTNGAGDFTITFPQAFPNGLLAVTCNSLIAARNFFLTVHDTGTNSAVAVRVYQQGGGVLASLATTINYIAIGW